MNQMRIFAVAGAAAMLGLPVQARAADMPSLPPVMRAPSLVQEYTSGWYVRGDLGYRFNNLGSVDSAVVLGPTGNRIDDAFALGGGAGFKWSWFRTDATVDYAFRHQYSGNVAGSAVTADVDSVVALGNMYADLGTWWGFTPYVGGGIGASWIRVGDLNAPWITGTMPHAANTWNFAWAGMAGLSYSVSPNLLLDGGYRYLSMGEASTSVDPAGRSLRLNDLTAHEFRLGLRYMLD